MVIHLDTSDSRTVKAIELAATAGQWARCHTANGQKMFGIPSSTDPLHLYLVTMTSCTCPSFAHSGRDCKHVIACRIFTGLRQAVQPVRRVDHSRQGNCNCYPQCAKAIADRTNR